ncbi:MAG: DUF438 domain-containing protein [Anaerococcus sp.]|uniref:DUF438 domain-containing protein n=1 Tax=Anaerococcus sp. TaxID=1872515 RepID=UPI0026236024|nr:DUF438 domain-containing protein [Anaerococcus sp.]MCI5972215.1 DUF438 domain-containing protein [Anaerococcus sp.]MDD6919104.1 DUF438 domain-containing protein [Peptoniphilaceae bacterium]MDY2927615.1 DUF438 domain-containing protein [Anaerococcus sp.]
MKVDINKTVFDLIEEKPELKDILTEIGFKGLDNPILLKSMGKKTSLKRGANLMGIENLADKIENYGYEVCDSSLDPEVIRRKELIKSYISRLSEGEDLERVRKDFKENFQGVSSSEIMDAEEELLQAGIDKDEVRRLCDVHSALFHGMTHKEKSKEESEDPFISYMERENEKIKEIIKKAKEDKDYEKLMSIGSHYKKKGDLIYPLLKVKYNKPGPSDVMWAVDIEIAKAIRKAIKKKDEKALNEAIQRAEEMTYKEDNILFPLLEENVKGEDLALLYKDLKDYDHSLISYEEIEDEDKKSIEEDGFVTFKKGKLSYDQIEAIFDTMDLELTFVDDKDINTYFNDHEGSKVFKRPESALGRPVYSCHPPKAEPIVRGLIKDFKEGKRDEFRLVRPIGGKDTAITYYAVRDKEGNYKGVLEVVQDLSFYKDYLIK